MTESIATIHDNIAKIDVDFDKLVLDEMKLQGLPLMFRLAESVNTILVHKSVKEHLTQKGFTGLLFSEVGDIAT
jgi:hypothetical protein